MIRFFGRGYDGSVYHGNERFMTTRPDGLCFSALPISPSLFPISAFDWLLWL